MGSVPGLGSAELAIAIWRGQAEAQLPGRVARLELPRHWAQKMLVWLAATQGAAGGLSSAQLTDLASADRPPWTAATAGLMAVTVVLQIAFGDMLPVRAMMLIGLAPMFCNGVAMPPVLTAAAFVRVMTAGPVSMAWR